jgi:hypothetical protein
VISKIAILVVALLVNSAGLLLCQLECNGHDVAQHRSSCHAQEDGPALQAGAGFDCAATPAADATTITKSTDTAKGRLALTPVRFQVSSLSACSPTLLRSRDRRSLVIPATSTRALRI